MILNTFKIGGWTFLSRVSGFLRDMLIAKFIGAGPLSDSFFLALMLPNFFRRFFAEGAFNAVFIPQFAQVRASRGLSGAQHYVQNIFNGLLVVLVILVGLFEWGAPVIIQTLAPGFTLTETRFLWTVQMARIMFPYIFFVALANVLGGVLNSFGRFSAAAAQQMLFNLSMIAALFLITPFLPTPGHALAVGVLVAGGLQLFFLYCKSRSLLSVSLKRPRITSDIPFFLKGFFAASIGASVTHVITLLNAFFASWLPTGTLSYLFYADRLVQFPLSVIGLALSTALLPALSRAVQNNDQADMQKLQNRAITLALFLTIPATCALLCLAHPLIQVLFERGAFDSASTHMTAHALMGYAFGLPAYVLGKIASTCFFAHQDPKTPAWISVFFVLTHVLSATFLYQSWGAPGIAFSLSIGSWVNALLLGIFLKRQKLLLIETVWRKTLLKILTATGLMVLFLKSVSPFFSLFLGGLNLTICLFIQIAGGLCVFMVSAFALQIVPRVTIQAYIERFLKAPRSRRRGGIK